MPPRSDHPGLKFLKNKRGKQPYWVAAQVVRDTKGFPDKCIRLPLHIDEAELHALCRDYSAELAKWIADVDAGTRPQLRYDGTWRSLSRIFQSHPESPFNSVKGTTRENYLKSLKIIEKSIGNRIVRRCTIVDAKSWHRKWKLPRYVDSEPRVKRAHDAISAVRMLLNWGFALGYDECGKLHERLSKIRFERGDAREQEMTIDHATAFIRTALEMEQSGKLPATRGRYMALGVAAQFELALRQKDIIGEWRAFDAATKDALRFGGEIWVGRFTWENIPGWKFRLKTSKNRAAAVFTLSNYPLLFPLLEDVPHDERIGAIVKGEHGLPVRERSYRKWFREIAGQAGIPDEIWSMDARAGAATEADEAGADLKAISDMLTHADQKTTVRYVRRREKGIADAAAARVRSRT